MKCEFHLATAKFHISFQTEYFTAMPEKVKLTALHDREGGNIGI